MKACGGMELELHYFYLDSRWRYSPPNIIRMIKSRRMRWARHVARMEETAMEFSFFSFSSDTAPFAVPVLGHDSFLPNPFLHLNPPVRRSGVSILKASLNNAREI
jgi:hypothetical protein